MDDLETKKKKNWIFETKATVMTIRTNSGSDNLKETIEHINQLNNQIKTKN